MADPTATDGDFHVNASSTPIDLAPYPGAGAEDRVERLMPGRCVAAARHAVVGRRLWLETGAGYTGPAATLDGPLACVTGAGVGGEKSDFSHCQVDDVDKAAAEPVSGPPRRCCATASRDSGDRLLDRASIVLGEKEEKRFPLTASSKCGRKRVERKTSHKMDSASRKVRLSGSC